MVKLIDGRKIAEKEKDKITKEIYNFNGPRPNLAIILVGDREDSKLYVSLKEKEGKKVGVDTHLYYLEADTSEEELLSVINFLNKDETVDGILIQLPLPAKFNTDKIISTVDPKKDADGFHPEHPEYIKSPVLASVSACLDYVGISGEGKTACFLYNSEVFGKSLEKVFKQRGFSTCPKQKKEQADLLVTALGNPNSIKKKDVKEDAVVIDIGISKINKEVFGDVDFEDVKDKVSYITPVPGGIGPMTIAFLFRNVLEIFKRRHKINT